MEKRYVTMCRSETVDMTETDRQQKVLDEAVRHEKGKIVRQYIEFGKADIMKLRTLRAMAIDGEFDVLLFESLEVFGYAPDEVQEEVRFLNKYGVKVISAEEGEMTPDNIAYLYRKQFIVC